MKKQTGFTLIELVVVIVILGILAATALPKFLDLSTDADKAAAQGVAGAIASATAINYAGRQMSPVKTGTISLSSATACASVGPILQGGIPSGFTVTSNTGSCATAGTDSVTCTVTSSAKGQSAVATLICAS